MATALVTSPSTVKVSSSATLASPCAPTGYSSGVERAVGITITGAGGGAFGVDVGVGAGAGAAGFSSSIDKDCAKQGAVTLVSMSVHTAVLPRTIPSNN